MSKIAPENSDEVFGFGLSHMEGFAEEDRRKFTYVTEPLRAFSQNREESENGLDETEIDTSRFGLDITRVADLAQVFDRTRERLAEVFMDLSPMCRGVFAGFFDDERMAMMKSLYEGSEGSDVRNMERFEKDPYTFSPDFSEPPQKVIKAINGFNKRVLNPLFGMLEGKANHGGGKSPKKKKSKRRRNVPGSHSARGRGHANRRTSSHRPRPPRSSAGRIDPEVVVLPPKANGSHSKPAEIKYVAAGEMPTKAENMYSPEQIVPALEGMNRTLRFDEALKVVENFLRAHPDTQDVAFYEQAIFACVRLSRRDPGLRKIALTLWDRISDKGGISSATYGEIVSVHASLAEAGGKEGDDHLETAVFLARERAKKFEDDSLASLMAGNLCAKSLRPKEALRYIDRAFELNVRRHDFEISKAHISALYDFADRLIADSNKDDFLDLIELCKKHSLLGKFALDFLSFKLYATRVRHLGSTHACEQALNFLKIISGSVLRKHFKDEFLEVFDGFVEVICEKGWDREIAYVSLLCDKNGLPSERLFNSMRGNIDQRMAAISSPGQLVAMARGYLDANPNYSSVSFFEQYINACFRLTNGPQFNSTEERYEYLVDLWQKIEDKTAVSDSTYRNVFLALRSLLQNEGKRDKYLPIAAALAENFSEVIGGFYSHFYLAEVALLKNDTEALMANVDCLLELPNDFPDFDLKMVISLVRKTANISLVECDDLGRALKYADFLEGFSSSDKFVTTLRERIHASGGVPVNHDQKKEEDEVESLGAVTSVLETASQTFKPDVAVVASEVREVTEVVGDGETEVKDYVSESSEATFEGPFAEFYQKLSEADFSVVEEVRALFKEKPPKKRGRKKVGLASLHTEDEGALFVAVANLAIRTEEGRSLALDFFDQAMESTKDEAKLHKIREMAIQCGAFSGEYRRIYEPYIKPYLKTLAEDNEDISYDLYVLLAALIHFNNGARLVKSIKEMSDRVTFVDGADKLAYAEVVYNIIGRMAEKKSRFLKGLTNFLSEDLSLRKKSSEGAALFREMAAVVYKNNGDVEMAAGFGWREGLDGELSDKLRGHFEEESSRVSEPEKEFAIEDVKVDVTAESGDLDVPPVALVEEIDISKEVQAAVEQEALKARSGLVYQLLGDLMVQSNVDAARAVVHLSLSYGDLDPEDVDDAASALKVLTTANELEDEDVSVMYEFLKTCVESDLDNRDLIRLTFAKLSDHLDHTEFSTKENLFKMLVAWLEKDIDFADGFGICHNLVLLLGFEDDRYRQKVGEFAQKWADAQYVARDKSKETVS